MNKAVVVITVNGGKTGLSQSGKKGPIKTIKKREVDYKRLGTAKSRSVGPRHESHARNPERCTFTIP